MHQLVKLILLSLLAFVFSASSTVAAPAKSKSSTARQTSTKPAAAPVKPTAKPPVKAAPKATSPTRTYTAGGKEGPCACSKGKSCRDGAGKRYCVESNGRKRIIG